MCLLVAGSDLLTSAPEDKDSGGEYVLHVLFNGSRAENFR